MKYKATFKKRCHVSDATYYRIFITDFIDSELNKILYLDADVICIKTSRVIKNIRKIRKI